MGYRRLDRHVLACGVAAVALILPSAAFAQTVAPGTAVPSPQAVPATAPIASEAAPGEIVVTAQRRNERQVDVPISIAAIGPQQLATANVQNLADIARVTTAVRFDSQAAFVQPSIRGIGTGITTSGGGANVGIYIDGFYSPNPLASDFQLLNVSSIQVLKGPQGTLFGRNTTGGAILVSTADPSSTSEFQAKATYGSYNAQRYQGYATFGIANGLAMNVEGIFAKGNGFLTNIIDNDHNIGAYENWTVRTGLKYEVSPDVSILARYIHAYSNDPTSQLVNSNTDTTTDPTTGRPWSVQTLTVPGTFTTDPDKVATSIKPYTHITSDTGQLTIKADLGFANLTSYTQYKHENSDQSEDLDHTAITIFQLGLPVTDTTVTQELLLTSQPGSRLQWTAGLFYYNNKDKWVTFIDNGVGTPVGRILLGGSGTTTESIAGFVDATYQLTDRLFLTGGVRVSHDVVKDDYYNTAFSTAKVFEPGIHSNRATPRAVIRFKPDDHSSLYASYTKGYKAAIVDVGGSCQDSGDNFQCNPIKPESIDAYEVGYKYANHGFSFETAAYYYNYRNLQVSEYLGSAQAYIVNAAKSEIYGLEGTLHYDFDRHLSVDLGGSWNHARYKTFGNATTGAPIYESCPADGTVVAACGPGDFDYVNTGTILHNTHMQHTPDFTANADARYTTGMTRSGEYSLSGNLYYTSAIYFSPSGTQFRQPGYATLSLRAQWQDVSRRFTLAVFGDNVTDKRYRTQVQFNAFGIGAQWSAPATIAVEGGVKF